MFRTVELNWGKSLYHTSPSSPVSQDTICQIVCLYSYVWPHSDKILEYSSFQAPKRGFWAPEAKWPRVESGHYEFCYGPMYQLSENTSENKLSRKHPESWT